MLCFVSCAGMGKESGVPKPVPAVSIAVFPIENLSGSKAPLSAIRERLIMHVKKAGFVVIPDDELAQFMNRNRIRYTGGVDSETALALRREMGASGVLITSLELYNEVAPPKVALNARLVSTGATPLIIWTDGAGLAGDDSPGILALRLIEDPYLLVEKALEQVVGSLAEFAGGGKRKTVEAGRRYRPKISYRAPLPDPEHRYTLAVIPFFNKSQRKYAGEIMVLNVTDQLKRFDNVDLLEPGAVRDAFLSLRIIMQDGLSLSEANALFSALDVDLILSGVVYEYQDYQGSMGKPKVDFAVQIIERKTQQIFWSSVSHNEGDDGVYFFDWGRVNTAHAMASSMIQALAHVMFAPPEASRTALKKEQVVTPSSSRGVKDKIKERIQ